MKAYLTLAGILLLPAFLNTRSHAQSLQLSSQPDQVISLERTTFPQKKIADCTDAKSIVYWQDVAFSYSAEGLSLRGTDNNGGTWSATVPAGDVLSCEIWSSKLKKESKGDLLILDRGQGSSGYNSELTIFTFDKSGRPVPWRANGAFTSTRNGIEQIVSGDLNGNAAIIVPTRGGDRRDGYVYVHHLIAVNQDGFQKIVGSRYSSNWPIITGNRHALAGTETLETLTEHVEASDLQKSDPFLKTVTPPNKVLGGIALSDGRTSMFPAMLVVDSASKKRTIFVAGDVPDELEKMTNGKYSVQLTGQSCEEEGCRPLLLLATEER